MEEKDYIVTKIEGEYAFLTEIGKTESEPIFVALFLLPAGTDVGTKLHYSMLSYEIKND